MVYQKDKDEVNWNCQTILDYGLTQYSKLEEEQLVQLCMELV